jgi:hypothetical protein
MADPNVYLPTDERQPKQNYQGAADRHHLDYQRYGPPPRNFRVTRKRYMRKDDKGKTISSFTEAYYEDTVTGTGRRKGGLWDHPYSPAGQSKDPHIQDEFTDNRPPVPGLFFPPSYSPGKFRWVFHKNWQTALAAAFTAKGSRTVNKGPLTEKTIDDFVNLLKKANKYEPSYDLYHPSDRNTAIFDGEPECSLVAHYFGTGWTLNIACPLTNADGSGWDRIWQPHNRPPIRFRTSTGPQGIKPPLFLGCITKENSVLNEWVKREVYWYTLEPVAGTDFKGRWDLMYSP